MTRPFLPYFDPSRPVFVKQNGLQVADVFLKQGDFYDWKNLNPDHDKIQQMFYSDQLYHNAEFEEKREEEVAKLPVGDGLDELTLEQLHVVIDRINDRVKQNTKTAKEFSDKKCPKVPKDRGTQIRRIRNWRLTYGELEK